MKVLVADFDKTLFSEHYYENIKAINNFVDQGNLFIIATGRNLTDLLRKIDGHDIKYSYLICSDGGVIYNNELKKMHTVMLDFNTVKAVVKKLKKDRNVVEVLVDNGCILMPDLKDEVVTVVGRYQNQHLAFKTLNKIIDNYPSVYGYISTYWINILAKKANKGNAIKYLEEKLNFSKNDIFTIGDNVNDISMNQLYCGYAMQNAHEGLKKVSVGTVKTITELIEIISQK